MQQIRISIITALAIEMGNLLSSKNCIGLSLVFVVVTVSFGIGVGIGTAAGAVDAVQSASSRKSAAVQLEPETTVRFLDFLPFVQSPYKPQSENTVGNAVVQVADSVKTSPGPATPASNVLERVIEPRTHELYSPHAENTGQACVLHGSIWTRSAGLVEITLPSVFGIIPRILFRVPLPHGAEHALNGVNCVK